VDTLLGLLGLAAWIAAVIVLAAAITWLVIRIGPGEKPSKQS
jgi:hypothetical protein